MSCDVSACLSALGEGRWAANAVWNFAAPACCSFGHVGPSRAADVLRGRRLVFVGDSQSRRHMWAVVDAVGGPNRAIRRHHGKAVADSNVAFDHGAINVNDTMYDSQRAYHAGQTVLLNVNTGKWVMLDPLQLCGVGRKYWMTDHRLTGAIKRGHAPPWHIMRGTQYRLRIRLSLANATASADAGVAFDRRLRVGRGSEGQPSGQLTPEGVRSAVETLAFQALRGWGCQKSRVQDCTFDGAIQRNCARRLSVSLDAKALDAHPTSGTAMHTVAEPRLRLRQGGRRHSATGAHAASMARALSGGGDGLPIMISFGEIGGSCHHAAMELRHVLAASIAPITVVDAGRLAATGDAGGSGRRLASDRQGQPQQQRRRLRAVPSPQQQQQQQRGMHLRRGRTGGGAGGSRGGFGGRGGQSGVANSVVAAVFAELPENIRQTLSLVGRHGGVETAPHCVNYCRRTSYLECPPSSPPYEALVQAAAAQHAVALGLNPSDVTALHDAMARSSSPLAVLTFLYAASLEGDMTDTFAKWNPRSYGHGADAIIVGATWQSVMRTRPLSSASPQPGNGGSGAAASAAVELSWDSNLDRAWSAALAACAKAAPCLLRTVPEQLRQPARRVYTDFARHVMPLAAATKSAVVDSFPGTWSGAQSGLMRHHDSTRIHFSDTGRAFLAQLTLNALPLLLPRPPASAPPVAPNELDGKLDLGRLVPLR